jgi:hypothetical protein
MLFVSHKTGKGVFYIMSVLRIMLRIMTGTGIAPERNTLRQRSIL